MASITNIHSQEEFERMYGDRKPGFYSGLLAEVVRYGQPGPILDLGAGLGLFTELAHNWGFDVTGLEASAYAIDAARKRVKGIKMIAHDLGNRFPFRDESVCNVVVHQVLEHLDRERASCLLKESYRVLKYEGRIFIYSPSRRNLKEKAEPTHRNLLLPSELRRDLELQGLKILREPNSGFWFMPTNSGAVARAISWLLHRILPHDWITATANVIASKTEKNSSS